MSRVLATGPRVPVAVTAAAAVFFHVGVAAGATAAAMFEEIFAWQRGLRDLVAYRLSQYEIEIEKEPPPPEPEQPKEAPKEEPPEPKPVVKDNTPPPEPPPQPAQAGKILAADPDPNEPVDLTDSFVQGAGDTYAGGQTSSTGTSQKAIYNPAAANTGVPGGAGTAPAPPVQVHKEDKSRLPGLLGSVDWNDCPFPAEADAEQIDQAFVMIQVRVKPDGSPESVAVLQDPGHGFGREARKCAMRKKFSPGLDPDGRPIAGTTKPFRVRFER
jgi:protein TonB